MSDCHGARRAAETVLDRHEDIKTVFFLGDGVNDIESIMPFYTGRHFFTVSGNCDRRSTAPLQDIASVDGVRVLYTHGHGFYVKYTLENLYAAAESSGASLALYGHTHKAAAEYRDGIYLVNPGALYGSREGGNGYAVIDVTAGGIVTSLMKI